MIAKIVQGRGFKGVVNYVLDKKDAQLLSANGIRLRDKGSIINSFITQSKLNNISKPVAHISLSFSAQDKDKLTNQKMVQIALEYMRKMGYGNTQFLITRHHDTDHPHIHLLLNRIDHDGKRISDQNERIRSTKACKELTEKYGLYFAKGKENVKEHRLREPDKTKYEIYNILKSEVSRSNDWQELIAKLNKKGVTVELKTRGSTDKIEGVKFSKNGYSFSGSKVDKQFSFSKIEFTLRQNNRVEEQRIEPQQATEEQKPNHIEQSSSITGGLFDMPVQPYGDDPEEEHFRRLMQRKKKKGIRR